MDILSAIEAILFAAGDSVPMKRLSLVLDASEKEIEQAAEQLIYRYEAEKRGMRVLKFNGKLQMCSASEYASIISKTLETRKPPMLSQAALETLAVVAYFQPVTRAYIDRVRGVDSGYTVSLLTEKKLITPCGKLDAPGRPTLFATTDVFLRTLGIGSVEELPELPPLDSNEGIDKLRKTIEALQKAEKDGGQIDIAEVEEQSEG